MATNGIDCKSGQALQYAANQTFGFIKAGGSNDQFIVVGKQVLGVCERGSKLDFKN
jgi:hypothetical protein